MADHCQLRPITRSDLDGLAALERDAFADPWTRAQLAAAMRWPGAVALLAEDADGVAGYVLGRVVVDEGEILSLATATRRRRQGLGRRLLDAALDVMRLRRVHAVWLEVRPSNLAARALYHGAGFQETARRRDYYRLPPEDALVLRREFASSGSPVREPDASA